MTFPSSSGGRPALADSLGEIQQIATNIKSRAQSTRDRATVQNVLALELLELQAGLKKRLDRLNVLKTEPGLAAYAQEQLDDVGFDIAAEFTTMLTEVQLTLDQLRTDLPTSAAGFVEARKIEADDTVTNKFFTPAQTATLRTRLDALIATID